MEQLRASPDLAATLGRNAERIQASWTRMIHSLPGSRYARRSTGEISRWTARGLRAVIASLSSGSAEPLQAHVKQIIEVRRNLGYDARELFCEFLRLKEAAGPIIVEVAPPGSQQATEMLSDLDACIRAMVGEVGRLHALAERDAIDPEEDVSSETSLMGLQPADGTPDLEAMLEELSRCLRSALKATYCGILVTDEQSGVFHRRAGGGALESEQARTLLSRILRPGFDPHTEKELSARRPIIFAEDELCPFLGGARCSSFGLGSVVALPILVREKPLSIALAATPKETGSPTPAQMSLALEIVSTIGPAVDHARVYAELRRNLSEIQTLHRMSTAFFEASDTFSMFELVCKESQRLTGAQSVAILLRDEQERLRTAISFGGTPDVPDQFVVEALRGTPSNRTVEPIVFSDIPNARKVPRIPALRSLAAVPLRVGGELMGVLQLINKKKGFNDRDLHLLTRIADQAAIAIEHSRLHDRHEATAVLEERQRVARNLHDSVSQLIYGVSMLGEAAARLLERGETAAAVENLRELRDVAQKALWEMRLLIFELHPLDLRKHGLVHALQERLSAVENRAGLKTEFDCRGVERLPLNIEEGLYRIAQEALNNAIKHAQATKLSLRLSLHGRFVRLEIVDNGVGFNVDAGRQIGGLGLRGMEERTSRIHGRISIASSHGRGARIVVDVPLSAGTEAVFSPWGSSPEWPPNPRNETNQ